MKIIKIFIALNLFSVVGYSQTTACDNEDFELSAAGTITVANQVQGWVAYNGTNTPAGNCTLVNTTYTNTAASEIINPWTTGYVDSYIGAQYPLYSVLESHLIMADQQIHQLEQCLEVVS
ncbi:MAG: hypothetical protein IPG08_15610 [Sphingobacteriaceae bacterium]|nr:hypothetical protein [Sphingobacteriaceae bacterium]